MHLALFGVFHHDVDGTNNVTYIVVQQQQQQQSQFH